MTSSTSTTTPPRRWPRPGEWPVWVAPLLTLVIGVAGTSFSNYRVSTQGGDGLLGPNTLLDPFGYLLLVVSPALLLARRRHPVAVVVAVQCISLLYNLRDYPPGPVYLANVIAYVTAVMAGHRIAVWATAVGGFAASAGGAGLAQALDLEVLPTRPAGLAQGGAVLGWTLVILIAAELARISSERAADRRRTQAEEQRRQASEERLRIARELHDVLAHNISMINVQAGVALHLMDEKPEQARTALAAIKDASREALNEMRSVLGVIRQGGETAPRAPAAGLDRLDELVSRARTAGLQVTTSIEGARRPLPGGVDLAAFRIVQEALTNVTRHAKPSPNGAEAVSAAIQITYGEHDVSVQVTDDGRTASLVAEQPGGNGIAGMRERAAVLGGQFTAGPVAGDGFRVWARLPLSGEPPSERSGR